MRPSERSVTFHTGQSARCPSSTGYRATLKPLTGAGGGGHGATATSGAGFSAGDGRPANPAAGAAGVTVPPDPVAGFARLTWPSLSASSFFRSSLERAGAAQAQPTPISVSVVSIFHEPLG